MRFRLAATAACGFALLAGSCASEGKSGKRPTTRPSAAQAKHDRALRDPFGYKPDWNGTGVSGGGTGELDKEGLRRDIDHVFIR